jgi:transcriptional regulator with XRE-family HTH domain
MKQPARGRASAEGADPIDLEVGHNLRQARLARAITQSELADALGVSFQQVQKYERGANRLSASRLVRAAHFLGLAASELLPPEGAPAAAAPMTRRLSDTPGLMEMVDAYCAVGDLALRRAVLTLLRTVKAKARADDEPA